MSSNREVTMAEKKQFLRDTLHSRTVTDDRGGRYAAIGKPHIVGTSPIAYPKIASGPWSEGIDQVSSPEPLYDATDCSDTYIGEPLGSPAEATSEPGQSPPKPALTLGASLSTSNFRRRI
jgi:hypothetical protein